MEAGYEGFSIREYTRNVRSVDILKCCPFPGEFTGDFIQSLLPPLTVTKFRWWSHELTSLLKDPKPAIRPKANAESSFCKKRSIGETTTNDLVLHKKKNIKTKKLDDSLDAKTHNKVYNCQEQAGERVDDDGKCSFGVKEIFGVMSPSKKNAGVRCFSYTEEEELFPDSPRLVSQDCDSEFQIHGASKVAKRKVCSVTSPDIDASQCERQVRLSLQLCCSQMNRLSLCSAEEQSPNVMSNDQTSDIRQLNKFQPVVSERQSSHARAKSGLSCFPGPHLTLERIKDALALERKRHSAESAFDKGVGMSPVHIEKRHKYYPARLGLDETFTENEFFVPDTTDGECGHTTNQEARSQNLSSRDMVTTPDGLCLHNTMSTMRLMGRDVSVGTSYSDMVTRGERIIASDASLDYSFLGSWLWTTLGENHSTTSLDKSWNTSLLCDTSKDTTLFPMFFEPHVALAPFSELPPTIMYPLVSCPLTDKDLYFHESGLGQQLNSTVTFSPQQLPFPYNPEIAGLLNVGVGCLLPDAREQSLGLPFSCTDSTRQSRFHWPQSSFESSRLDMSSINPAELN